MKRSVLNKGFMLASLGYFFVYFSASVFYLFPLYLDTFHPSKSRVGLIMGIHSVTAIMVRPLFGRVLDRQGGRIVSIAGILIMIASMPGFYLLESAGILAILLRAVNGIGWGLATTAMLAICSDLAPSGRMAHSLGLIGVAGIISQAIGPAAAEEILRFYSFSAVFTVSLIMLAASLFCIAVIREAAQTTMQEKPERTRSVSAYPFLILLVIAAMPTIHGAARGTVLNFIALYGASIGFGRIGPFFLAFSAAAIITRLGLGGVSDRYGRKRVILPSAILIGVNLLWIAGLHSYWAFVISGFVAGLGQGLIFPALSTYLIDFLGHKNKGFALGLYLSLFDIGMGLGSPVFGWILDVSGYRRMYVVAGCLIILSTIIFSIKAPPLKK
ncbi:MAG: MFS transporter [Acidobacteria bacterium]|nr:MFS transporter [Acidobacteriota bacterium]